MFISKQKINETEIKLFYGTIDKMEKNKFGAIDQIKAAVTYATLYIYNPNVYNLKITKAFKDNDIYRKGFNFYKSIIEDLTEESELILIFLQLNSGASKEILNNKTCYKITMLSVEEIKEHLIKNIPQFFFVYNRKSGEEISISDSKTQIIGFNEEELFHKKKK